MRSRIFTLFVVILAASLARAAEPPTDSQPKSDAPAPAVEVDAGTQKVLDEINSLNAYQRPNLPLKLEDRYAHTADESVPHGQVQPDKNAALHFGDPSTPDNRRTYLPACVTGATYLINAGLMKGHSLAAVTLCAKNHYGSVYRENTGPKDSLASGPGTKPPTFSRKKRAVRLWPMGTNGNVSCTRRLDHS